MADKRTRSDDIIGSPTEAGTVPEPFTFDRLGLRVPSLIVSPWVPKGIVENRVLQHTSVITTD